MTTDQFAATERLLAALGRRWTIEPWPTTDRYPIDSPYIEIAWLPILGPTALWLARRLAHLTIDGPATVDMARLARALGVSPNLSPRAPIIRAGARLVCFNVARPIPGGLAVHDRLGELPARHAAHLERTMPAPLTSQGE